MTLDRRHFVAGTLAAPALLRAGAARAATTIKVSHQFPGGTIDKGDFRDRLCRRFAAEVGKRSNGDINVEVYANSSLMKTNAQFSALRKGALDASLFPLPYAGGEAPETTPAQLRINVTSPGGTTEAALRVLMADDGLKPLMEKAVAAADARAKALSG